MNKLNLLIVEGNTKEENINFNSAGCVSQSQNFKLHVNKIKQNCEIDIVEPGNDESVSKILTPSKVGRSGLSIVSTLPAPSTVKDKAKGSFCRTERLLRTASNL